MQIKSIYYHQYHKFIILLTLFLAAAITTGPVYGFGLFLEPLQNHFDWQKSVIMASLSFGAFGSITTPIVGRILDRSGSKITMTISLLFFSISYLLRPMMSQIWHWYALSLLQSISYSGTSNLPAGRLIGIWFPKHRGRIYGIATMGNNFGGLTVPLFTGFYIAKGEWQTGFLLIGGITLFISFLSMLFISDTPQISKKESINGLDSKTNYLSGDTLQQTIKSETFYLIFFSALLGTFLYSAVLPQMGDHLVSLNIDIKMAPIYISMLATFGMTGKLIFGYLSEKYTARFAMILSLTGQIIFLIMLSTVQNKNIIPIYLAIFGIFMGGYGALFSLVIQEAFGLKNYGSIAGVIGFSSIIPLFFGPLLSGFSFDYYGSYTFSFIIISIFFCFSILLLFLVKLRNSKYPKYPIKPNSNF